MALTLYLSQTLVALWLFYGYLPGPHWMGQLRPSILLAICAVSFAAQAVIAAWWSGRFRFGPMEWLWRSLEVLGSASLFAGWSLSGYRSFAQFYRFYLSEHSDPVSLPSAFRGNRVCHYLGGGRRFSLTSYGLLFLALFCRIRLRLGRPFFL